MGDKANVLVIGAGAAGLAAARELSMSGLGGGVLEARDRIGGRIYTRRDNATALPVELTRNSFTRGSLSEEQRGGLQQGHLEYQVTLRVYFKLEGEEERRLGAAPCSHPEGEIRVDEDCPVKECATTI